MNKKTLMKFIQQISEKSSVFKAKLSLNELKRVLEQQNVSEEMIEIVRIAIESIPEVKGASEKGELTEEDLKIAHSRAKDRIAREEAARAYGRC